MERSGYRPADDTPSLCAYYPAYAGKYGARKRLSQCDTPLATFFYMRYSTYMVQLKTSWLHATPMESNMTKVELKNDPKSDKRKQSVYFPVDMLDEIQKEALRQDRTVSWIVQRAWKIARDEILLYPSINDPSGDEAQLIAPITDDKDEV